MSARRYPHSPLITLSTHASPLLRLSTVCRIAEAAELDGVDLDMSFCPLRRVSCFATIAERYPVPIRSVWVPARPLWLAWWQARAPQVAAELARTNGAATLVVDLPMENGGEVSRALLTGLTESVRAVVHPSTRIAVALRARNLEGGRRHLVQLTALRRLGEEWDFGIALDLVGAIDPRWEAEAAVSRLGSRLIMLRVDGQLLTKVPSYGRHRPAARALAAALDAGHTSEFALVPHVPPWQRGWAPALIRACSEESGRIRDRYSAIEDDRAATTYPQPRPG